MYSTLKMMDMIFLVDVIYVSLEDLFKAIKQKRK